ncbi:hypothetical protein H4R33_004379 [Dimargaris cristalligena]|uniref:Uncharacterized protein n=1 Tax=Dimargaris cristalligena TaxID=215637 RepID=A0A4V1J559_9FUNG|nr:hypothetical protein H4R33_004379 [Dimargaris cristalligena]RKP37919.1 hypothetical protein BJ085DRAFT_32676 [Dimargaris cristalligena]|eukprot:RKP37919.1 hypothetical protein BJ085DRAFT_32676 [Dimargaris cristalligena]
MKFTATLFTVAALAAVSTIQVQANFEGTNTFDRYTQDLKKAYTLKPLADAYRHLGFGWVVPTELSGDWHFGGHGDKFGSRGEEYRRPSYVDAKGADSYRKGAVKPTY